MLDILVGGFYGDEGKGKIASYLALADKPSIAVRTGGTNAGHTVVADGKTFKLRTLPAAFVNKDTILAISPGAVINRNILFKEMDETGSKERIFIDPHTAVITDQEIKDEEIDTLLAGTVGSTKQGVGSAESKRVLRRLKLAESYPDLSRYIKNVPELAVNALEKNKKVFVEGTQGHMISLYHGAYPYVTSRNTTASGILSEVGVGPKYVGNVMVIFKSFITRVGAGPLQRELPEEAIRKEFEERGTVTGRKRRVAPFDKNLAREVIRINSANQVAITKLDSMFKDAYKKRRYEDLPFEAKRWIETVENALRVPIALIGTGEDALDIIDLRKPAK